MPTNLSTISLATALCVALCAAAPLAARLPNDAPPLGPVDPSAYTIVHVSTAQELADACWNLASDTAILIAPGVYRLAEVEFPNGVDGRLTVGGFGAPPISNIQIRGATGDPRDVVILGDGPLDPIVPFGFQLFTSTDVLIADLSVGNVYYHAVAIQGDQGAKRLHLYHVRAFDAGQQIVKSSGAGADDVTIEYSESFHSAGAVEHPEGSPPNSCYTNAVDALGVDGWIVRDNLIYGIKCQNGELAGPAILIWRGSAGSTIERNTILDSSRGVSLGLGVGDHSGGIVRNNFIRWDPAAPYQIDVPIYSTSPGSRLIHNTALTRGRYPNAIEVRYADTRDVVVARNLLDAAVTPRDGADPTIADNITGAELIWFVDDAVGDLRLTDRAGPALDQVDRVDAASRDFTAALRPPFSRTTDIGASELAPLRLKARVLPVP